MKEVWSLKKIVVKHMKNFLESREQKTSQENAQQPTSVARGWANGPWQCSPKHYGCFNKETSRLWIWNATSCTLQSIHESTSLIFIPIVKITLRARCFSSLKELSTDGTWAIWHMKKSVVLDRIIMLPELWDSVTEKQGDCIEGLWTYNVKEIKVLGKNVVYTTFYTASVFRSFSIFQHSSFRNVLKYFEIVSVIIK